MKLPKSVKKKDVNVDETVSDMEHYQSECTAKKFLKLPCNGTESGMSSASNASDTSYTSNGTCSSSLVSSSCCSTESSVSESTTVVDEYHSAKYKRKVMKIRNNRHRHFKIHIEDIMEEDCDIEEFQGSLVSSSNTMNSAATESTAYYTNSPGSEIEEKMAIKSE